VKNYFNFKFLSYLFLGITYIYFFNGLTESTEKLAYLINGFICAFFIIAFYILLKNLLSSLWLVGVTVSLLKISTLYKIKNLGQPLYFSDVLLIPYFIFSTQLLKRYWVDVLFVGVFIVCFFTLLILSLKKNKIKKNEIIISVFFSFVFCLLWFFCF
jgi:hypothetical protein